jgi:hypothetical protein
MAFGWDDLIVLGASIFGANAAKDAGKKQAAGSAAALAEQQRQYNIGLNMLEPQRGLGYGAMGDIAHLYGYPMAGYTPLNQLGQGVGGSGGGIEVRGGRTGGNSLMNAATLGVFGGGSRRWGGSIDPTTGTVDVANGHDNKDKFLTNYLRTGEWDGGVGRYADLKREIDALRASGWSYNPETGTTSVQDREPQGQQPGPAGNMDRFFASPDYNFRRTEGQRGLEQSAAGRGGIFGGDTAKDLASFNSGLASGEFGNYMNRLFNIAGMGQTATSQGVNLGQNYGANAGNLMQQQADSRASGVMGAANTWASGAGSLMNNQLLKRLLGQGGGYEVPEDIRNFKYPFGG